MCRPFSGRVFVHVSCQSQDQARRWCTAKANAETVRLVSWISVRRQWWIPSLMRFTHTPPLIIKLIKWAQAKLKDWTAQSEEKKTYVFIFVWRFTANMLLVVVAYVLQLMRISVKFNFSWYFLLYELKHYIIY